MRTYEAPAKLNLSLLVSPPRVDGYHPLESLVQTIEWCDLLEVGAGEGHDSLDSDIEDNLVLKAIEQLRRSAEVPALAMKLTKAIPVAAGLGGGSSDAAAALRAAADIAGLSEDLVRDAAFRVGADVSLFLTGGSLIMTGVGDDLAVVEPFTDFAVAVVVPEFELASAEVYQRWDRLEGPVGTPVPDECLPPALRSGMPMRNDLLPAALDIEPRLGDFMVDVRAVWGVAPCLTGSGSACFGYFATLGEASDAAESVDGLAVVARGVALRDVGVKRVEEPVVQ
jgi:4-diphosphocytidyl-2-C-methyl-D-erythritol kinase